METRLSRVIVLSASSWRIENNPAERSASFKVASSYCSNGSKFRRRDPGELVNIVKGDAKKFLFTSDELGLFEWK